MKNILIIGKGYIGNHLYNEFNKQNFNVHIVSKKDLDYTSVEELKKFLITSIKYHYIINCSGFTGIPNIDQAEIKKIDCWKYNVQVPLNISKVCKQLNIQYVNISTGCIYTGYEKEYTEEDIPNFGMFDTSSFYSKSKHAYETLADYGMILRIRMPYCNTPCDKNFISKIIKYNNIVDYKNSKTYISDISSFLIHFMTNNTHSATDVGILNFVNSDALYTKEIAEILSQRNLHNPLWQFTDIQNLQLAAPRSNCVLSTNKLSTMFPQFKMQTERDAILDAIQDW